uniref:Uncharacterized protein n=1 Tax=viral metagenome TaxID=1070528 RepID=A0A6M3JX38_9ZZZZ
MDKNRVFHELIGRTDWHKIVKQQPYELDGVAVGSLFICSCGLELHGAAVSMHLVLSNPDYAADPRLVLREMMKREDWENFMAGLFGCFVFSTGAAMNLATYMTDTTGRFRDAAIAFMKEKDHE